MPTEDEAAISILKAIAQARLEPEAGELPPDAELRSALAAAFGRPDAAPASEGELARAALDLLRQDPVLAQDIQLMSIETGESSSHQRYLATAATIGLVTAALTVVQTRVRFKRDHTGKWSLEVDKKSSSDSTLKLLVQRLLPFLGK